LTKYFKWRNFVLPERSEIHIPGDDFYSITLFCEDRMLTYSVLIFAIAAVGGLILASKVLTGKLAPWALSIIHALLGATGLILLALAATSGSANGRTTAALALLVIAALGGFYLASYHLRKKIAPKAVVVIHAGVAVAGFLTLLTVLFNV
jgi:hypothetical protein